MALAIASIQEGYFSTLLGLVYLERRKLLPNGVTGRRCTWRHSEG